MLSIFHRTKRKVDNSQTIADLKRLAKKNVPRATFDFVEGGAQREISYARSTAAFSNLQLNVSISKNFSDVDTSTNIFGRKVDLPIIFAPTGYTRFMYHVGEPAVAAVAEANNMIYCLSTMGTTSPDELATAVPGVRRWFQLYMMRNREDSLRTLKVARENGFETLVVTVDTPVAAYRPRDIRNGLTIPPHLGIRTIAQVIAKPRWWLNLITTKRLEFAAFRGWNKPMADIASYLFDPSMTFEDARWLKSVWEGPIIIKGIQSVADAIMCKEIGLDGVILSNHGGRQLDRGTVPLELLPKVVEAVGPDFDVYVDGAVMSGEDVYGAIACGAKGVLIGRSYLYGIMAGGQYGVQRAVDILRQELIRTMRFCGAGTLQDAQTLGARIRES
jgi:isopentenyl diphosphate isomerase/L-lactate dehydrogenase-like FMN-dependent dehydrogenase